jgi:hypothetical protein
MTTNAASRLEQCRARYAQLKSELQELGFVCVGSLQTRHLECGKPTCHCHESPSNRHGPYHYWTRKVAGKTVSVLVSDEDLVRYREWIASNRALDRVVREMRKISARALTLRTARKPR